MWAIGTGRSAGASQAQEMHAFIRETLSRQATDLANTPILYGGSVKPATASELFAQADIDGALIGGAALDASQFLDIIRSAAFQALS
ncbi:triose-phosphate isomerase [Paraburkholderia nemoris]|uniref:triose-phosphate isomerase n=1 Tax=Paraburkholderia nemoris TaxID=2793076 RepID=UPI0039A4FE88